MASSLIKGINKQHNKRFFKHHLLQVSLSNRRNNCDPLMDKLQTAKTSSALTEMVLNLRMIIFLNLHRVLKGLILEMYSFVNCVLYYLFLKVLC